MRNLIEKTYITATLVLLISLMSCEEKTNESELSGAGLNPNEVTITKKQFEASEMTLTKITEQPFSEILLVNGVLDVPPEYKAAVSAYFGGYVKNISILPGQHIKKGQTLFTLENPEFIKMQQEYLENKGQLDYLKNDYERQEALLDDKVSSKKDYLKAKAAYESTYAKQASLKKQLQLLNINVSRLKADNIHSIVAIRTPIEGYINDVYAERGRYLQAQDVAVMITNPEHIHVELNIYEKDYNKLSVDQQFSFKLQNDINMQYAAKVYLVNRSIENQQRIVKVHGHLIDEEVKRELIPGMYVEARIPTSQSLKPALPSRAIVEIDKVNYVLLLSQKTDSSYIFEKKLIELGSSNEEFTNTLNAKNFSENAQFLNAGAFSMISD